MAECNLNSTYEPSAIVQAIHDLPRFHAPLNLFGDGQFASFVDYMQALWFWVVTPGTLGCCIFMIFFIYCCCICCFCCCRRRDREKSKIVKAGCILFQSSLFSLCLGIIGASMYMEVKLNDSISETIGLSSAILTTANDLVAEASSYNSQGVDSAIGELSTELNCNNILSYSAVECVALRTLRGANDEITQVLTSISSSFTTILSTEAGDVLFTAPSEIVNHFETTRHWLVIGNLCLGAVLLLAHCLSVVGSFRCSIIYFLLLLTIATSFIWDGLGGLLGFTIILADICIDPIDVIGNLTGLIDPFANITTSTFYLSCQCNPFGEDIAMLNSAIDDAQAALMTVEDTGASQEQIEIISNALTAVEATSNTITDLLQCETSYGNTTYLDQTLYNFCTDGFGSMAVTFFLLAGLAIVLVIIIYSSTFFVGFLCSTRQRTGYSDRDLVPFDNGHASWGDSYSTSYSKPYSATNPCSLAPASAGYNFGQSPGLTSGAPPNYLELQVQNPGHLSEEYDRYQA